MLKICSSIKKKKRKNGKKKIWIEISKDMKCSLKVKLSSLMAFSRLSFHSWCWKLGNKVIFSFLFDIILEVWKSQRLIFFLKKKKGTFTSMCNNSFVFRCFVVFQIIHGSEGKQVFFKYILVLFCELWYNLWYKKKIWGKLCDKIECNNFKLFFARLL